MTRTEAKRVRLPRKMILAVKQEMEGERNSTGLESYVAEWGSYVEVLIDADGEVEGRLNDKDWVWLTERKVKDFLVWLNGQVYFPFLEAWVETKGRRA